MNRPSLALFGAGRWGQKLLERLHALDVLHTVVVRQPEKYHAWQERYPTVEWANDPMVVWQNPAISGVVIATPPSTHKDLVEAALQHGKHVLCEKPLTLSLADAQALIALSKRQQRCIAVGHILRYHPAIQKIRSLLAQGYIGRLHTIESERLGFAAYPLWEDVIWGLAIHDLDLLPWLVEAEPEAVTVEGSRPLQGNLLEAVQISMRFPYGIRGFIRASWRSPHRRRTLTLTGTEGILVFQEDFPQGQLLHYPIQTQWLKGQAPVLALTSEPNPLPYPTDEPLILELSDFIRSIQEHRSPVTAAETVLGAIRLAERLSRQLDPQVAPPLPYFVHPTAILDEDIEVGAGTKIWHFSHVLKGSRIGRDCVLGQNVVVGPFVRIGNNCKIQNNVSLYYGVELEDGVLCGPSCVFTNDKYPRAFIERRNEFLMTRVRRGATIGANATIMCGVVIGQFAMVGAGAVVTQDVPDHALVLGNPARQVGWVCTCGETLDKLREGIWQCKRCNLLYEETLKGLAVCAHTQP